jgi:uncharacterized protein with GYD domain
MILLTDIADLVSWFNDLQFYNQRLEWRNKMEIYITQGNYTEAAVKGMIQNPEDRALAVAALMEAVGAKMLQYYVTHGEYDFLVITEADETDANMLAGLMVAGSSGGACNLKTTRAFTTQEAKLSMEKAGQVVAGFSTAGSGG